MSYQNNIQGIYIAPRGSTFKTFINNVLKTNKVSQRFRRMLIDKSSINIFHKAFTSDTVDIHNNYQMLEQIGDLSGNKFIVNYMYNRFPKLQCPGGVKIVARLRINYGAKQSFSEIARRLNFWPYISCTNDIRQRKMKSLLEDVFESFLGAMETIIDNKTHIGVGYAIVYNFLSTIFDKMNISLRYEDLYDSKTRLKELFDMNEDKLGHLVYKESKINHITESVVYRVVSPIYKRNKDGSINKKIILNGVYIKIGKGSSALKANAQQNAASNSLYNLKNQGFTKSPPIIYQKINNDWEEPIITKSYLLHKCDNNINNLIESKDKFKYNNYYKCTLLSTYCKKGDLNTIKLLLKLGIDSSIKDSDGLYSCDLLIINNKGNEKLVYDIISTIYNHTNIKINITSSIYKMYIHNDIYNIGQFLDII